MQGLVLTPLWLPIMASGILFWLVVKRNRGDWCHPGRIMIGFYFLLSVASLASDEIMTPTFKSHVTWDVMAGYTLLMCLTLMPALLIRRPDPASIAGHRFVPPVAWVLGPLVVFASVYLVPWALTSSERGFAATRQALNFTGEHVLPESILTTLAVATAMYYEIFAILLFALLVRRSGPLPKVIAGAGVGLAVVHSAVFSSRDGVFWATHAFLIGYWSLGALLPRRLRRRVIVIALCSLAVGLVYIGAVTKDRFGERVGGYYSGTVGYFGMQPFVFSETVERRFDYFGPNLRFPVVAQLMGQQESVQRTEPYEWSFGTFLTDFYAVSGWSSAIGLSLLLTGFVLAGLRFCRNKSALAYTLVVAAYTQFMVQGVFYYRLGSAPGNYYHLSVIAIIVAIAVFAPDRKLRLREVRHTLRESLVVPSPGLLASDAGEQVWLAVQTKQVASRPSADPLTRSGGPSTENHVCWNSGAKKGRIFRWLSGIVCPSR